MKKILLCVTILLALAACKEEDENRKVVLAKTPDGHPFYFMPIYDDGNADISIFIAWPTDWAYDGSANPAVPYIAAEAILSGGTKAIAPQDVLELFKDKDILGQLYVEPNHIMGELTFPKEHTKDAISIASEMLASPQFDPAWVARIKQGFLADLTQYHTKTANKMWTVARLAILGEGALNDFLNLSDPEEIKDVSVDDLRRWHSKTILKDGITIAVTGAINRKDAGKAVDQLLLGLPKGNPLDIGADTQPNFAPRTILLHVPDAEKTTLGLIGQSPSEAEDESADFNDLLAVEFFSSSDNGPLFDAVRTKLRASYAFGAEYINYDRATRIIAIAGELETAKLAQAVDLVRATYEAYRTNPDFNGLSEFQQRMVTGMEQNMLNVDIAATVIIQLALDGLNPGDAPRFAELFAAVTEKDVKERLASVFPPGNALIVVAASPDSDALPGACVITEIKQAAQCP